MRRTVRELAAENAVLLDKLEKLRDDLDDFLSDSDDDPEDDDDSSDDDEEGER